MSTPTILYLHNHYCNSLEDLQHVFQQDDIEGIQLDILASYRDGILTSWLSEGDECCKRMAENLEKIDSSKLGNSELFIRLAGVINNQIGATSDYKITYNINDYADFLGCIYERGAGQFENRMTANGSIVITEGEDLSLSFNYQFKITNPETESLNLQFQVKNNTDNLFEEVKPLRLNVSRNAVQDIVFSVNTEVLERGVYDIILKCDEVIISCINLAYKIKLNLRFGNNVVNLVYVKGSGHIQDFYMSDTPVVYSDGDGKPITGRSYNEICGFLSDWEKKYGIVFKLPTVKQWMYAAKGGVNQDSYKYAGSDDINEVAWYWENTGSGYYYRELQKVRQKKPNSIGLYDMSGNVWEMSEDKLETNPNKRYILGGSYEDSSDKLELSNCKDSIGCSKECRSNVGFRVVCVVNDVVKLIEKHPEYFAFPETERSRAKSSAKKNDNHEYVDLGLSVKWATCNVGASSPSDYGDYFAWGETESKDDYSWDTYKWCNGIKDSMTKYCINKEYGVVDSKIILESQDDVAHVKWGGNWRMPTKEEFKELREKCTWEMIALEDRYGYRIAGPSGKSIFLPAAGGCSDINFNARGLFGYYWSATLDENDSKNAYFLSILINRCYSIYSSGCNRCFGLTVRPVTD